MFSNPPSITSDGGGATATIAIAENTNVVTTVTATDPDFGAVLVFTITGGADQAKFRVQASSGLLAFIAGPDFEAPTDSDADNSYVVQVSVTDGVFNDAQTITVNVTDAIGLSRGPSQAFGPIMTASMRGSTCRAIPTWRWPASIPRTTTTLRTARRAQSERLVRHRRLSRALHRRSGRGRRSAAALLAVRLARGPRPVGALRHARLSRRQSRRRGGARQPARSLPAVWNPRRPHGRSMTDCSTETTRRRPREAAAGFANHARREDGPTPESRTG